MPAGSCAVRYDLRGSLRKFFPLPQARGSTQHCGSPETLRREEQVKNLKKLRVMTGRGQFWLAEETGIERTRISLLENGRVQASEKEKASIEKALLAAMRENIAQFSRLSGTAIANL
jgi:DNA-binding XRE family transcriptional regulator